MTNININTTATTFAAFAAAHGITVAEVEAVNAKSLRAFAVDRSGDTLKIDPRVVRIQEGYNRRAFDRDDVQAHLSFLKANIAENGVKNPVKAHVEDGFVFLTDGECRLRSVWANIVEDMLAGREPKIVAIPVIGEAKGTNEADRLVEQVLANTGLPFTPLEKADVVKGLLAFGWTEKQVSEKLSMSEARVNQLLSLAAAPESVKQMVREEKVSATLATEVLNKSATTAEAVTTLTAAVDTAKETGKAKATKKHVAKTNGDLSPAQRVKKAKELVAKVEVTEGDVTVDAETWKAIREALGLKNAEVIQFPGKAEDQDEAANG